MRRHDVLRRRRRRRRNRRPPLAARRPPPPAEMVEHRDWASIHQDVLSIIFEKLGAAELLLSAEVVCRSWRQLSLDTTCQVWRSFDTRHRLDTKESSKFFNRYAIDRSGGNLEILHLDAYYSPNLINYLIGRTPRLRCLVLCKVFLNKEKMLNLLSQCPVLEEIDINACRWFSETFACIVRACPELKRLRLNEHNMSMDPEADTESNYKCFVYDKILQLVPLLDSMSTDEKLEYINGFEESKENVRSDKIALEIANNLPQLRELSFISSGITNKGLHAILDKCIELEFLDLRCCFDLRVDDVLQAKLSKIKTVRLSPHSLVSFNRELSSYMVLSEFKIRTDSVS